MVFSSQIKYYLILCGKCGKFINKWQETQLLLKPFFLVSFSCGCFIFFFFFFLVEWLEIRQKNDIVPSIKSLQRPFFFLQSAINLTTAVKPEWRKKQKSKKTKQKKTHYQFHLFPQLYPHLNYGCLTYCMEREIKQTDEGTSQGDMWVSVESQAG